ncbi:hypothetical protein [Tsukamurella hominis]|uniref:hypothetical protein n=1 Tax=Tsukamurella hominis TaxID=1970232 RepID=UPI0039EBFC18
MTGYFDKSPAEAVADTRAMLASIGAVSKEGRAKLDKQRLSGAKVRRSQPGTLEQRYLHAKSELLRVTADYAHAHGIDVSAARKELEAIAAAAGDPT